MELAQVKNKLHQLMSKKCNVLTLINIESVPLPLFLLPVRRSGNKSVIGNTFIARYYLTTRKRRPLTRIFYIIRHHCLLLKIADAYIEAFADQLKL